MINIFVAIIFSAYPGSSPGCLLQVRHYCLHTKLHRAFRCHPAAIVLYYYYQLYSEVSFYFINDTYLNLAGPGKNIGRSWALTFNSDHTCIQTGDFRSNETGAFTLTEQIILSKKIQYVNITFNGRIENYSYSFISRDTLRLDENLDVDGLSNFFVKR